MLKIGEFARICNVSPHTLRYYNDEGVLCPDETDPATGYRYYSPEQVETFRLIQSYKEAGFALEEIKVLIHGDPARHDALMAMKRAEISEGVRNLQNKLSLLELLSRQEERRGEFDMFVRNERFEDHPEVLGMWELCGQIRAPIDGDFPHPTAPLESIEREDVSRWLVFRPEGDTWWMFCWSRGFLYWMSEVPRTLVPNPYVLWETEEGRYMTVRYYATAPCLDRGGPPIWLLYRQVKHAALTEEESRVMVDNTDLPSAPDPEVLGDWETVTYVRDPMEFSRRSIPKRRIHLWILGARFEDDNVFVRRIAWAGRAVERQYTYTRFERPSREGSGAVLDKRQRLVETYLLREVDGETFLFIQHKSGDYMYGGRKPVWYVFRRSLSNTENKTKNGR